VQEVALAREVSFLWGSFMLESQQVMDAVEYAEELGNIRNVESVAPNFYYSTSSEYYMVFICRKGYQEWKWSNNQTQAFVSTMITRVCDFTIEQRCSSPRGRVLGRWDFLEVMAQVSRLVKKFQYQNCTPSSFTSSFISKRMIAACVGGQSLAMLCMVVETRIYLLGA
jgi:hypothetical protein